MLLTVARINELNALLDAARVASTGPGQGHYCAEPHRDPRTGADHRLEPKPKGRRPILEKVGHEVVEVDGLLHVKVPLGAHGRGHLGIDPETGEVRCALCAKLAGQKGGR